MIDPDISSTDAEREPPAWRRSVFWQHEDRIREMLERGRSYRQILAALHLRHMHRSVLARWCQRQGLQSAAPPRGRPRTNKNSAPLQATATPTVQPAQVKTTTKPISEALGPEPGDEWAAFRKPASEDR